MIHLVRVEQRPIGDGRTAPVTVTWDAWDTDGRHYLLEYAAPFGSVYLDSGRDLTQFARAGLYAAVLDLEEFLRLAGLRYEPTGAGA